MIEGMFWGFVLAFGIDLIGWLWKRRKTFFKRKPKQDWVRNPAIDPEWVIINEIGAIVRERKAVSWVDFESGKTRWEWELKFAGLRLPLKQIEQVRCRTFDEMRSPKPKNTPERFGLKV
jgi:hypothetical protein